MITSVEFDRIATIASPYKEKFAIPRQPGLANAAQGKVIFTPDYNQPEMVKGLEQFSHIWLIFQFHQTAEQGWKPLVRPPRLGGNDKLGVLATRSTFRPNPIGMSVVKLDGIDYQDKQLTLLISALDLLDGTPILDIKPYIPYADAITDANAGYAQSPPDETLAVVFSPGARNTLNHYQTAYATLETLIEQVLSQDPRPAYKKNKADKKIYGIQLFDLNITWQLKNSSTIEVLTITSI